MFIVFDRDMLHTTSRPAQTLLEATEDFMDINGLTQMEMTELPLRFVKGLTGEIEIDFQMVVKEA